MLLYSSCVGKPEAQRPDTISSTEPGVGRRVVEKGWPARGPGACARQRTSCVGSFSSCTSDLEPWRLATQNTGSADEKGRQTPAHCGKGTGKGQPRDRKLSGKAQLHRKSCGPTSAGTCEGGARKPDVHRATLPSGVPDGLTVGRPQPTVSAEPPWGQWRGPPPEVMRPLLSCTRGGVRGTWRRRGACSALPGVCMGAGRRPWGTGGDCQGLGTLLLPEAERTLTLRAPVMKQAHQSPLPLTQCQRKPAGTEGLESSRIP